MYSMSAFRSFLLLVMGLILYEEVRQSEGQSHPTNYLPSMKFCQGAEGKWRSYPLPNVNMRVSNLSSSTSYNTVEPSDAWMSDKAPHLTV